MRGESPAGYRGRVCTYGHGSSAIWRLEQPALMRLIRRIKKAVDSDAFSKGNQACVELARVVAYPLTRRGARAKITIIPATMTATPPIRL